MEIPFWHPVVVHFPIVLLLVGGAAGLVWAVSAWPFARHTALLLLTLGAVSALVATRTGEAIEHEVEGQPNAERYLDDHERTGEWTLYAAVAATLAVGAGEWLERRRARTANEGRGARLAVRVVAGVLALAAAGLVARTGHLGGLMTWGVPPDAPAQAAPPLGG